MPVAWPPLLGTRLRGRDAFGVGRAVSAPWRRQARLGAYGRRGRRPVVAAVGAENEYANVIGQIGGQVRRGRDHEQPEHRPPHLRGEPERGPGGERGAARGPERRRLRHLHEQDRSGVARARAQGHRRPDLLGLPDSTPNPHLWYSPKTMPAVAKAIASRPVRARPGRRRYFQANVTTFDNSLKPWLAAIAKVKAKLPRRPGGDHRAGRRLHAAGRRDRQHDPLDAAGRHHERRRPLAAGRRLQESLFSQHKVKVFLYNQQVTDSITETFLADAKKAGVPVVGVYETMPTPGYDYQSWMLAEVNALIRALSAKQSTEKL